MTAFASSGVPSENNTSSRRPIRQVVPPSAVSMDLARYGCAVPSGASLSSESYTALASAFPFWTVGSKLTISRSLPMINVPPRFGVPSAARSPP
jgi:hypothetical protein